MSFNTQFIVESSGIEKKRELDEVGVQVIPQTLEHSGLARAYLA